MKKIRLHSYILVGTLFLINSLFAIEPEEFEHDQIEKKREIERKEQEKNKERIQRLQEYEKQRRYKKSTTRPEEKHLVSDATATNIQTEGSFHLKPQEALPEPIDYTEQKLPDIAPDLSDIAPELPDNLADFFQEPVNQQPALTTQEIAIKEIQSLNTLKENLQSLTPSITTAKNINNSLETISTQIAELDELIKTNPQETIEYLLKKLSLNDAELSQLNDAIEKISKILELKTEIANNLQPLKINLDQTITNLKNLKESYTNYTNSATSAMQSKFITKAELKENYLPIIDDLKTSLDTKTASLINNKLDKTVFDLQTNFTSQQTSFDAIKINQSYLKNLIEEAQTALESPQPKLPELPIPDVLPKRERTTISLEALNKQEVMSKLTDLQQQIHDLIQLKNYTISKGSPLENINDDIETIRKNTNTIKDLYSKLNIIQKRLESLITSNDVVTIHRYKNEAVSLQREIQNLQEQTKTLISNIHPSESLLQEQETLVHIQELYEQYQTTLEWAKKKNFILSATPDVIKTELRKIFEKNDPNSLYQLQDFSTDFETVKQDFENIENILNSQSQFNEILIDKATNLLPKSTSQIPIDQNLITSAIPQEEIQSLLTEYNNFIDSINAGKRNINNLAIHLTELQKSIIDATKNLQDNTRSINISDSKILNEKNSQLQKITTDIEKQIERIKTLDLDPTDPLSYDDYIKEVNTLRGLYFDNTEMITSIQKSLSSFNQEKETSGEAIQKINDSMNSLLRLKQEYVEQYNLLQSNKEQISSSIKALDNISDQLQKKQELQETRATNLLDTLKKDRDPNNLESIALYQQYEQNILAQLIDISGQKKSLLNITTPHLESFEKFTNSSFVSTSYGNEVDPIYNAQTILQKYDSLTISLENLNQSINDFDSLKAESDKLFEKAKELRIQKEQTDKIQKEKQQKDLITQTFKDHVQALLKTIDPNNTLQSELNGIDQNSQQSEVFSSAVEQNKSDVQKTILDLNNTLTTLQDTLAQKKLKTDIQQTLDSYTQTTLPTLEHDYQEQLKKYQNSLETYNRFSESIDENIKFCQDVLTKTTNLEEIKQLIKNSNIELIDKKILDLTNKDIESYETLIEQYKQQLQKLEKIKDTMTLSDQSASIDGQYQDAIKAITTKIKELQNQLNQKQDFYEIPDETLEELREIDATARITLRLYEADPSKTNALNDALNTSKNELEKLDPSSPDYQEKSEVILNKFQETANNISKPKENIIEKAKNKALADIHQSADAIEETLSSLLDKKYEFSPEINDRIKNLVNSLRSEAENIASESRTAINSSNENDPDYQNTLDTIVKKQQTSFDTLLHDYQTLIKSLTEEQQKVQVDEATSRKDIFEEEDADWNRQVKEMFDAINNQKTQENQKKFLEKFQQYLPNIDITNITKSITQKAPEKPEISTINNVLNELTTLKEQALQIQQKVASLTPDSNLTEVQTNLNALQDSLRSKMQAYQSTIADYTSKLTTYNDFYTQLRTDLTQYQTDFKQQQQALNQAQELLNDPTVSQATKDQAQQRIAEITQKLQEYETKITSLKQITESNVSISLDQSLAESYNIQTTDLQNAIYTIENSLNSLEQENKFNAFKAALPTIDAQGLQQLLDQATPDNPNPDILNTTSTTLNNSLEQLKELQTRIQAADATSNIMDLQKQLSDLKAIITQHITDYKEALEHYNQTTQTYNDFFTQIDTQIPIYQQSLQEYQQKLTNAQQLLEDPNLSLEAQTKAQDEIAAIKNSITKYESLIQDIEKKNTTKTITDISSITSKGEATIAEINNLLKENSQALDELQIKQTEQAKRQNIEQESFNTLQQEYDNLLKQIKDQQEKDLALLFNELPSSDLQPTPEKQAQYEQAIAQSKLSDEQLKAEQNIISQEATELNQLLQEIQRNLQEAQNEEYKRKLQELINQQESELQELINQENSIAQALQEREATGKQTIFLEKMNELLSKTISTDKLQTLLAEKPQPPTTQRLQDNLSSLQQNLTALDKLYQDIENADSTTNLEPLLNTFTKLQESIAESQLAYTNNQEAFNQSLELKKQYYESLESQLPQYQTTYETYKTALTEAKNLLQAEVQISTEQREQLVEKITTLEEQLKNYQQIMDLLSNELQQHSQDSIESLDSDHQALTKNISEKIESIRTEINDLQRTQLLRQFKKILITTTIDTKGIDDQKTSINTFTEPIQQSIVNLKEIQQSLLTLTDSITTTNIDNIAIQLDTLEQKLKMQVQNYQETLSQKPEILQNPQALLEEINAIKQEINDLPNRIEKIKDLIKQTDKSIATDEFVQDVNNLIENVKKDTQLSLKSLETLETIVQSIDTNTHEYDQLVQEINKSIADIKQKISNAPQIPQPEKPTQDQKEQKTPKEPSKGEPQNNDISVKKEKQTSTASDVSPDSLNTSDTHGHPHHQHKKKKTEQLKEQLIEIKQDAAQSAQPESTPVQSLEGENLIDTTALPSPQDISDIQINPIAPAPIAESIPQKEKTESKTIIPKKQKDKKSYIPPQTVLPSLDQKGQYYPIKPTYQYPARSRDAGLNYRPTTYNQFSTNYQDYGSYQPITTEDYSQTYANRASDFQYDDIQEPYYPDQQEEPETVPTLEEEKEEPSTEIIEEAPIEEESEITTTKQIKEKPLAKETITKTIPDQVTMTEKKVQQKIAIQHVPKKVSTLKAEKRIIPKIIKTTPTLTEKESEPTTIDILFNIGMTIITAIVFSIFI